MRRIQFAILPDEYNPGDRSADMDYAEVLRQIMRRPLDNQSGIGVEEMRSSIRVLDKIDAVPPGGVLELEDADWEQLKKKTLAMPWAIVDRRILTIINAVTEAPEVSAQPSNGQAILDTAAPGWPDVSTVR